MSFTNVFLILLILDAISFTTAGIIAISGDDDCPISTGTGLIYFTYSVLTSVMGYIGCILIHSCVNSFDVNAIVFMWSTQDAVFVFENRAFSLGCFLILVKFVYYFALVPFQQYIVEAASMVNYAILFIILVVLKFPLFMAFVTFMKII